MPKIAATQISVNKQDKQNILHEVSFEVETGEIVCIIGPSGAGKSTLLRLINRLNEPSSGNIYFDGTDVCKMPVVGLRQKVGMVFQQPALFAGTVVDNILYGPRLRREKGVEAIEFLDMVGLPSEFLSRDIGTLSGGQQQRVSLARTLANRPEVLLLDEPTSALDIRSTEQLESLILRLVQSMGLTVLWVTHLIEQAKRVSDRVMLLVSGELNEFSPTNHFFTEKGSDIKQKFLAGELD